MMTKSAKDYDAGKMALIWFRDIYAPELGLDDPKLTELLIKKHKEVNSSIDKRLGKLRKKPSSKDTEGRTEGSKGGILNIIWFRNKYAPELGLDDPKLTDILIEKHREIWNEMMKK